MLADLVHGGGCAEDGPDGGPNALSKLSGALSRGFGQEQLARRAPDGAGPSSSFAGPSEELIPEPSAQDAAFLEAFAGDGPVPLDARMRGPAAELAWRHAAIAAAADHRSRMQPMDARSMLATADAAWAFGAPGFAPESPGSLGFAAAPHWQPEPGRHHFSAGEPAPPSSAELHAGMLVRQTLHMAEQPGAAAALASDPHRWDSLRSLDLPAPQLEAAVRRADRLMAQMQPQPVPEPAWRSHRHVDAFTAAGLPPQQWQPAAYTAQRAQASALQRSRARADAADETVRDFNALQEQGVEGWGAEGRVEAVWRPAGGDMVAEMEAAWAAAGQPPTAAAEGSARAAVGLQRGEAGSSTAVTPAVSSAVTPAASSALTAAGSQLDSLEDAWGELSLDGGAGGMDRLWESIQQAGVEGADAEAVASAWEAAMFTGMDEYMFREGNPYLGQPGLLAHGSALFERGELAEAVLALEAAVQAEPEDSAAWQLLGQAHADADDDTRAIACLRRAVSSDAHNLDALLALGVSYTNELDQTRALEHLQLWLQSHPDFHSVDPEPPRGHPTGPFELQRRVTSLFQQALGVAPRNPDLHAVLGVLHNLNRDYSAAIASFETALELRPTDYSLWNKLGATRANSLSCEAAVPCYIRALELKPHYVRALSNLGISYANLNSHQAAAQCYLKALSLNSDADHVWGYLTMVFSSMGRPDLVGKAARHEHATLCAQLDV